MGYQKNGDDNGRIEGTMDELTSEHIVGKSEYFKRDQSGNDKDADETRKWEEELQEEYDPQNDTKEIITEITESSDDNEVTDNANT